LFGLIFIGNLFAFTVEDITVDKKIFYRIYIGDDKKTDWIDLIGKYNLEQDKFIFEDRSPIKSIDVNNYRIVLVVKEKSLWKIYWSPNPLEIIVVLLEPYIPEKVTPLIWKTIYKK
jgi:hypothetical protein